MKTQNTLKKKDLIIGLIIVLACIVLGFTDFIKVNTLVKIQCDKKANICKITEDRMLLPQKNISFAFNTVQSVESNVTFHYKTLNRYSLNILLKNGNIIKTYNGTIDQTTIEQISGYLNKFIKSSKADKLIINSPQKSNIIVTAPFLGSLFMFFVLFFTYRAISTGKIIII